MAEKKRTGSKPEFPEIKAAVSCLKGWAGKEHVQDKGRRGVFFPLFGTSVGQQQHFPEAWSQQEHVDALVARHRGAANIAPCIGKRQIMNIDSIRIDALL